MLFNNHHHHRGVPVNKQVDPFIPFPLPPLFPPFPSPLVISRSANWQGLLERAVLVVQAPLALHHFALHHLSGRTWGMIGRSKDHRSPERSFGHWELV